ncbi:MAG: hypothetical protein Ct9H90mP25_3610 [Gammaproteobacteria bacterium]|nr:MAG: hypothetical protein Ct9H90mP25_3610 [Gammaproteobacteria bacterium]
MFTTLKVLVILFFIVASLTVVSTPQPISFLPKVGDVELITNGAFAVALIYVSFAFSGWNAATYLSSEIESPQKTLPLVLISGTSIVTLLYLGLNYVFLYTTPIDSMIGEVEVGAIAARTIFGEVAGNLFGLALAFFLYQQLGNDNGRASCHPSCRRRLPQIKLSRSEKRFGDTCKINLSSIRNRYHFYCLLDIRVGACVRWVHNGAQYFC